MKNNPRRRDVGSRCKYGTLLLASKPSDILDKHQHERELYPPLYNKKYIFNYIMIIKHWSRNNLNIMELMSAKYINRSESPRGNNFVLKRGKLWELMHLRIHKKRHKMSYSWYLHCLLVFNQSYYREGLPVGQLEALNVCQVKHPAE